MDGGGEERCVTGGVRRGSVGVDGNREERKVSGGRDERKMDGMREGGDGASQGIQSVMVKGGRRCSERKGQRERERIIQVVTHYKHRRPSSAGRGNDTWPAPGSNQSRR